ncbi:GTP cyclohydrolase 1 type 2/Nif3 [Cladorrhinum samala]|uniref:ATP phosphoribosyltransferase n=1 Tax=Cladorrhinum samala TaxID=585594 RepID=A0AAV9I3A0_9PEZI|nr:GTP cyclohydrolase 1 type 2/Nif3 [Cladorrhinum samala]
MATTAAASVVRYKLVFTVPSAALERCKEAVFAAGAGRYPGPGKYTEVCFTTLGTGQFRPGEGANPHIGKVGALEFVEEAKVETLCVGEETARKAVAALKKAHPYEEPAYEVYKLEDF